MKDNIFLGLGKLFIPIPGFLWRRMFTKNARDAEESLTFMSPAHHAVRDFVVKYLPEVNEPISAAHIATNLNMRLEDVEQIIDDLEQGMTFLYRGCPEGVTWAYPVTIDSTPHQVVFDNGRQTFAA
jgi:hypothetical protein